MIVLQMFFSQAAGNVTTNFLGIIIKVRSSNNHMGLEMLTLITRRDSATLN